LYLPENVLFVLNRLEKNKYDAHLVGGCVRDSIMGKTPNDYDITTNALPQEILDCFSDCKTLTNGIKHGTVGIIIDKEVYEVTTYRIDGEYSDNRHPDKVVFSDKLTDDLSRRDFTVNAIAISSDMTYCDPFDGISDIEKRVIKCVGLSDKRFNEDALRILRALRFSSVLDFDIDDDTALAIHRNSKLLGNISFERVNSEFSKLICGLRTEMLLKEYFDVFCVFIGELCNIDRKIYDEVASSMSQCDNSLVQRLCVFFSGLFDKTDTEAILTRLKYDNATINKVCRVVSLMGTQLINDTISVKKLISRAGFDIARLFGKTNRALKIWTKEQSDNFEKTVEKIEKNNECVFVSQLAVNGRDCIENIGVHGKIVGIILDSLCNDVIEGKIENSRDKLITAAKKYVKHLEGNSQL